MRAENRVLLTEAGYSGIILSDILQTIQMRYEAYVQKGKAFPHEIGVLLGYPAEDVKGFIENKAASSKCSGCWKVYGDEQTAMNLFEEYRKCTEICYRKWKNGADVEQLTVSI